MERRSRAGRIQWACRLTLRCTRRPTAGFARFRPRVNSNVNHHASSLAIQSSFLDIFWYCSHFPVRVTCWTISHRTVAHAQNCRGRHSRCRLFSCPWCMVPPGLLCAESTHKNLLFCNLGALPHHWITDERYCHVRYSGRAAPPRGDGDAPSQVAGAASARSGSQ